MRARVACRNWVPTTTASVRPDGEGVLGVRRQLVNKYAEQLKTGEFNWFPERSPDGPILIIVSIPDQLVHVYRNGIRVAASTCSTGKPGHSTPTGVFKILQKDKHHHSATYDNAPMPDVNRLTWSGIALHAGHLPGYPASHGCVRLPLEFSERLFGITKLGMTVVIANSDSDPESIVRPGMVLGNYARSEYAAVDMSLMKRRYEERYIERPRSTSVVVSRFDRKATVWEDHRIVATGNVSIEQPNKPIGNRVYTLTGANRNQQDLRWVASDFSQKRNREADGKALQRIKSDSAVREEVRKRMHHGMTLVVTDEQSRETNRGSNGFVVFNRTLPIRRSFWRRDFLRL